MNLENGLNKEWILTNGIGGYSYSSTLGCNTRKYHGLLVAPLTPPARRYVILSKLDEALEIDNTEYVLYTNMCKDFISQGYKNLVRFEKEYLPIFSYKIKNTEINFFILLPLIRLYFQIRRVFRFLHHLNLLSDIS